MQEGGTGAPHDGTKLANISLPTRRAKNALRVTDCLGLLDALDRLPVPSGHVFLIHHRPCDRNHRAKCKGHGSGKIPVANIHWHLWGCHGLHVC